MYGEQGTAGTGKWDTNPQEASPIQHRRDWTFFSAFAILTAICGAAYWWFFHYGRVTTDDAHVMADSARIGGRVSGTVLKVWVDNDHYVKAGDTLVELDPMDYQVAMDRASAVVERLKPMSRRPKPVSLWWTVRPEAKLKARSPF